MLKLFIRILLSWPLCLCGLIASLFRTKETQMDEDVDFVVLWVDGNDDEWKTCKKVWAH